MPNRYQLTFLLTFLSVFLSLFFVSRYIHYRLLQAGYDISNLILIGLPKNPSNTPPMTDAPFLDLQNNPAQVLEALKNLDVDSFRAVKLPLLDSPQDLIALATSTPFLVAAAVVLGSVVYSTVFRAGETKTLKPAVWQEFPLESKTKISPNTAVYRFKLPSSRHILGLPIGQHISVSAEINGKVITRSYTPVSSDEDHGHFELLIKTYEKGNISKHVDLLKVGDTIRVKGPKGNFTYRPGLTLHLSMIAGGTGITPMIQIIRAILRNPVDSTTVTLIYANVSHEDILLKNELDELLRAHGKQFKVLYVLNNPPAGWTGGVGFVTKEHIKEHLPNPAASDSKLLMCGPPPMISAMKKNLDELKYPAPQTISKLDHEIFVF